MTDNQNPEPEAHTKQDESVFSDRMIWVMNQ